VIKAGATGDSSTGMIGPPLFAAVGEPDAAAANVLAERRLRVLVDTQTDFVWRVLRRLGLPPDAAEDAAQQVFIVASRRLDEIKPEAEQAFLFRTAVHIASRTRRAFVRRREDLAEDPAASLVDAGPSTEELIDRKRARTLLEDALERMDIDTRSVFILFELEEKTTAEIAEMLDVPMGTVASRLRRARAEFEAFIKRSHAQSLGRRSP
jgi:RNA polymerase sigma-70 factor (ECF subfamily)